MVDSYFQVGEHIDCLDSVKKWCDAIILQREPSRIFVNYPGFSQKYNEWIDTDSVRI